MLQNSKLSNKMWNKTFPAKTACIIIIRKKLTAIQFIWLVDTVQDTVTTLARWNALSIVTPILASRTVYGTTAKLSVKR